MTQIVSRRFFLASAVGAALAARSLTLAEDRTPKLLDHILLGCRDFDAGIAFVEQSTGVRAAFGGVHPGAGTRNALLSLGENRYLEIIAPDPEQPESSDSRHLRDLDEPSLIGWAARPGDIETFAALLTARGFEIDGPKPGSRTKPDGRVLTWKVLALKSDPTGLLPFFIEWSADSLHPSVDSPHGCTLVRFEAATPQPEVLFPKVAQLNLDLPIVKSTDQHLHAVITGPKGMLDLVF
jgi:hypothetical protein